MISFDSLKFVWMQFVTNKLKFQDKQKNINWADELESARFLLWTVCVCVCVCGRIDITVYLLSA